MHNKRQKENEKILASLHKSVLSKIDYIRANLHTESNDNSFLRLFSLALGELQALPDTLDPPNLQSIMDVSAYITICATRLHHKAETLIVKDIEARKTDNA